MEKLKLTAKELQDTLHWSKSKVYYWINTKKFETVQTPYGQKILISQSEIEELKNDDSSEPIETEFEKVQTKSETVHKISDNQVIMTMLSMLQQQFNEKKDHVKLLTDSEHRTQSSYFELKTKFEHLQKQFETLQEELTKTKQEKTELSEKIEQLEQLQAEQKKSFFDRFKKQKTLVQKYQR